MPVVAGGNLLRTVITFLKLLRFQEFADGFFRASASHERVPVHMMGMRNCGSHARIESALFERVLGPPHVFVSVSAIVMRRKIPGSKRKRGPVKRECVHASGLAMSESAGLVS